MAADAGIFGQYLQPVKSVAAYRADMDREESNALQLAATRMQAQQAQQDFADGQTLRTATMEAAGDQNALVKALNAKGLYKQAQSIQASIQGAEKTAAEIAKNKAQTGSAEAQTSAAKFKLEQEKRAAAATRMATFKAPDEAIADLKAKVQSGEVTPEQGEQLAQAIPRDAAQFGQWQLGHLRSLLTPQQLIEQGTAKPTEISTGQQKYFVDNNPNSPTFGKQIGAAPVQLQASPEAVLTDARTRSEGAANRGVQMRGQNMTDARSRDANAATLATKSEKPLTEGQAKSALFGSRMKMANEIFDTLEKSGTTTSTPGINSGYGVGSVISALSSSDQQQLLQAKRDFLNAVLRRESGAVIGESEFDNGNKQYFPQVGDSKQVIAQKKANREAAMRGVLVDVPEGRRSEIVGEITGRSTGGATGSFGAPAKGGFKYLGSE